MATRMTPIRKEAIVVVVVAAAVLALSSYGVSAQSPILAPSSTLAPSPAGSNTCFNAVLNMSDCLTYVEEGSKQRKPDKACCPELAGLVESNPICLCQLLGNPDAITMGIKIDLKKALNLPNVCGVSTPPLTTCSAVGVPVSLPPDEPLSPGPAMSPEDAAGSPSGIAAATPSPGNHANGVSAASTFTFLLSLAMASFFIIF